MESLEDKLKNFRPASEAELDQIFPDLAGSFLYGGYIAVKDGNKEVWYRIYLRTVEFYCHAESNGSALPQDPIVYHRNGRYVDGDVPYFPLMAFHAHPSGYDITFENESLQLRASALIRAYEVYDVKRKGFLTYDKILRRFELNENQAERTNHQSTYLYDFLNGFIGDSVKWVDDVRPRTKALRIASRKNVFKYADGEKTSERDNRPWSFTRIEDWPF